LVVFRKLKTHETVLAALALGGLIRIAQSNTVAVVRMFLNPGFEFGPAESVRVDGRTVLVNVEVGTHFANPQSTWRGFAAL
jgi:hypothetical protein